MGIPDRWLNYSALGKLIAGTRFVAFKVPLSENLNRKVSEDQRFSPSHLMQLCPNLSLVVDLTNTSRYYNKTVFTSNAIKHEKIFCPGHQIPPEPLIRKFTEIVDAFLAHNDNPDGVIGIHCTHGVNRTGYFICRYMIERMGMSPESAFSAFKEGRGYGIERHNYIQDLSSKSSVKVNTSNALCKGKVDDNHIREIGRTYAARTAISGKPQWRSHDSRDTNTTKRCPQNRDSTKPQWLDRDNGLYSAYQVNRRINNRDNRKPNWQNSNFKSHECVNSGVDFGYEEPVSSGYGQPYGSRYNQRRGNSSSDYARERRNYVGNSAGRGYRNTTWINPAIRNPVDEQS